MIVGRREPAESHSQINFSQWKRSRTIEIEWLKSNHSYIYGMSTRGVTSR